MIASKHLFLSALVLVAFTSADSPRFAPEEKSSVEKTVRTEMEFSATDFAMSMDGNDLPKEMVGDVVLKFKETMKLVLTDRYVKVKDGRPVELDRTFDELVKTKQDTQKMPGQPEERVEDKTFESALESKTVRFSWNEKSEEYDTKFGGEEGDADLLVGLHEDIDYRMLLPKSDAKVGDTWKLEGKKLTNLLEIGGDLHFVQSDKSTEDESDDFSQQMDANLSGDTDVKFEEIREKDGMRLAVITFKGNLKSHANMEKQTMRAEVELEPEGELLWDLALNRMHAFTLEGKISMGIKGDQNLGGDGAGAHKLHIEIQMQGTFTVEIATKAL